MRWSLPILAGLALLTACASPPPLPEDVYYRLQALTRPERLPSPILDGTLVVEPVRAGGALQSRAMLYSDDSEGLRLREYNYHRWEDSPGRMLQQRLTHTLRQRGVARQVVDRPVAGADFRLSVDLERFERRLTGDTAAAVVALEFSLTTFDQSAVILVARHVETEPAGTRAMEATVQAFSRAVDRAISRFVAQLESGA